MKTVRGAGYRFSAAMKAFSPEREEQRTAYANF